MRVESPAINCDSSRMCLTISPAQQQGETHVVLVPPPLFALTPRLNTLCTHLLETQAAWSQILVV